MNENLGQRNIRTFKRFSFIPWMLLLYAIPLVIYVGWLYCHWRATDDRTGTLVFLVGKGAMDEAIKDATGQVTHVGIMITQKGKHYVVDATPEYGVSKRTFEEWEKAKAPDEQVLCLQPTFHFDIHYLKEVCEHAVGSPYDSAFSIYNNRYYCSELVQLAYASIGEYVIPLQPMNWRNSDGDMPSFWTEWFDRIGTPIPEGEPGTNPQQIYEFVKPQSRVLKIEN